MIEEPIFCYDIETKTENPNKPDPSKDHLRFIGFKQPDGKNLVYSHVQKDKIQKVWDEAKYICGHNIKKRIYKGFELGYDNQIMYRNGYKGTGKVFIDTQQILEKRAESMMYEDLLSFKLGYVAKHFNLPFQKGEFDFRLLQKDELTVEELRDMRKYLEGDLDTTHALLEYLYNMFKVAKKYVSQENRDNMSWLTCASGSLGYKIFCEQSGRPETYGSDGGVNNRFQGAIMYVHPIRRFFKDIVVNDFESLYPNIKANFHLSQRVIDNKLRWEGTYVAPEDQWTAKGTIFEGFIKGTYSKIAGEYEKSIVQRFNARKLVKKEMKQYTKDQVEYINLWFEQNGIKITLNSEYGAGGNPVFESMYDVVASGDTTGGARACITHAKDYYEERGYTVAYLHTDSCYIEDPFHDTQKVKTLAEEISKIQRENMLTDYGTHNFAYETHLQYLWLVRDDKDTKKNRNIRMYDDGSFGYTGIRLTNVQCSKLAVEVFNKFISPELAKGREDCEFPLQTIFDWVKEIGTTNPELLMQEKTAKHLNEYKGGSSIQAQISLRYGAGRHLLIPNKYIGAGKSKHYATLDELQATFKDRWTDTVVLGAYVNDLKEFVRVEDRKLISKL